MSVTLDAIAIDKARQSNKQLDRHSSDHHLVITQIRDIKMQLMSEDEKGVIEKVPGLFQQLSRYLLSEHGYGATVRREILLFLSKLTHLPGVHINLSIADQVEDTVTHLVLEHGAEWKQEDVKLALEIGSVLTRAAIYLKGNEGKLTFERGTTLLSHVFKVMRHLECRDYKHTYWDYCSCHRLTHLALGTLKETQRYCSRRRFRHSSDELPNKFHQYTEKVIRLADTDHPEEQFELESEILSQGFNYE